MDRPAGVVGDDAGVRTPTTPSDAGEVSGEDEYFQVHGILTLCLLSGENRSCRYDETSTVGFARARAAAFLCDLGFDSLARHSNAKNVTLLLGVRLLVNDYLKLYELSDAKDFSLHLNVLFTPD